MNSISRLTRSAFVLLAATLAFEALRMGASVFRGLIDLPARGRLGPVAFAELSRATDLSSAGFAFYVVYGVGGALLTGATFIVLLRTSAPRYVCWLSGVSAACSVLILLFTTQAAPAMLQVGSSPNDPVVLGALLDRFALWTYPRLACAAVSFVAIFTAFVRLAREVTAREAL